MNRKLRLLHRYLGIVSAFFILLLSLSGIMLNHTDDLELDTTYIDNPALLQWYGIQTTPITNFQAEQFWVSFDGNTVYINKEKTGNCKKLTGAHTFDTLLFISCENSLQIYNQHSQLIETIDKNFGLPTPVSGIGVNKKNNKQQIYLLSQGSYYQINSQTLAFNKLNSKSRQISLPAKAPTNVIKAIKIQSQNNGLNLERILLDIHSGRILGIFGVLLIDFAALLLIFMALSGLWVWLIRIR